MICARQFDGQGVTVTSGTYTGPETGAFEVTVKGKLVHSKLTKGQGKCSTDEEVAAPLRVERDAVYSRMPRRG
jgi:selT/selW/selH-like putative selenoprotein